MQTEERDQKRERMLCNRGLQSEEHVALSEKVDRKLAKRSTKCDGLYCYNHAIRKTHKST